MKICAAISLSANAYKQHYFFMKNIIKFVVIFTLFVSRAAAQDTSATPVNISPTPVPNQVVNPKNPESNSSSPVSPSKEPQTAITKTTGDSSPPSQYVPKNAPVRIPRLESAPTIDGQLTDAVWAKAAVFGDFRQIQPGDNIAPSFPTEVLIGYDAKNLYIAFRVKQDKNKVRATLSRRDNIFDDDFVGLQLDTFNDRRQAYTFFFNPLGIQADGTVSEGRGEDYSVDVVMESKGVLTEDGYTVEAAIPFKSLRYEAGKNKEWGIHIFRRIQSNNRETDSWMPIDRSRSGSLGQAGHITGLEDISTTRQLEINPSFTVSQTGRRTRFTFDQNPAGRFVNDRLKAEFGMTAKFSLTPTITLDFAYNPDFAQVEADAPVTTANQRFPIFFEEKRPFFLERIDIFQTRMNVVNTRAIVNPQIAAKLTGRRGRNTFGVLYASDKAPGNYSFDEREDLLHCRQSRLADPTVICGIERFVDKKADIGILRLKRDVGKENNIGFFATTYNFVERHNHTAGFDGRFRLDPKTAVEFQLTGTNSRRFFYDPNLDDNLYRTGNGFGYSYSFERADRNLTVEFNGVGRTRDYRADVGFTPRTDTNQHRSYIRYQTDQKPKNAIIYKRLQNESALSFDWRGRMQNWNTGTQAMIALQRQTYVGGGIGFGYERVFEYEFGANRTATRQGAFFGADSERSANSREAYVFIETAPVKKFNGSLVLAYTDGQLDYDLGAGRRFPRVSPAALLDPNNAFDPGAGKQFNIQSSFRYQASAALQISLSYNKQRLVRKDTKLTAFDDNIYSLRSTYQFTRSTFARMRIDYSTLSAHLRPQIVVGWTPNPGTAIYAGYNDDLNRNGYNPFTGSFEPGFRGNGRTFFIKASYLFRKSF